MKYLNNNASSLVRLNFSCARLCSLWSTGKSNCIDEFLRTLSPSLLPSDENNRSKDCVIKLNKYMSAGVKEYWIIDPENSVVLVYVFAKEGYPKHYSFGDKIPVYISGGKCEIDFSRFR